MPAVGEIVDVERPHCGRQGTAYAGERESHGFGLLSVDLEVNALAGRQIVGIHITDYLAFGGQFQQLCLSGQQRGIPPVGSVLQEQGEAGGGAQLVDGGRQQAHYRAFRNVCHSRLCQICLFGCRGAMTLIPIFEHGEGHGGIGACAGEAEALHH